MATAVRNNYDFPTSTQIVDADGNLTVPWAQWFQRTQNIVRTLNTSGPTTQRPIDVLWIGMTYFDTTIGKPIWVKSVPPKPSPAVWCDATGAPV